ncbi:MAG: carbon storage regulator CsrA [Clostridia bacterium]|jgi:carbon storage regulator|nr:carbon storage regulator CsrA [Clostridia bacterium]
MLTLSRKIEEAIVIGNDIEIKVLGIQGDTVKLGIDAPKNISIHRKEVYVQIKDANEQASKLNIKDLEGFMKK